MDDRLAEASARDRDDGVRTELLLHSLAALREVALPALDLADARHVVEVGGEAGGFTLHLARRAARVGGHVDVVDPAPSAELEAFVRETPDLDLVRRASPEALRDLAPADAYVLDGDHNYATVAGELATIREVAADRRFPLVLLHDVGWPCARRDQYYRPEALPADAVHPYRYDRGVTPESAGMVDGGFSGAGEFAYAAREGGPRNGVLTALDDFRAEHPYLSFVRVPSVFGLGVLFDHDAPYADALARELAWCDESPLLARLEDNRVALYLRLHDVLRELATVARQRDEARAALEDLRSALRALGDSRTVRAVDALARPVGALRGRARGRGSGLAAMLHDLADPPRAGTGDLERPAGNLGADGQPATTSRSDDEPA